MSAVAENATDVEHAAAIKFWTRNTLLLKDDEIVTVSEFDCSKPTCPNRRTVIMVMSQDGPQRQMSFHKSIANIGEFDVVEACAKLLQEPPA